MSKTPIKSTRIRPAALPPEEYTRRWKARAGVCQYVDLKLGACTLSWHPEDEPHEHESWRATIRQRIWNKRRANRAPKIRKRPE